MRSRSWRWLRTRIIGLLSAPPTVTPDGQLIEGTRLACVLYPPTVRK